MGFVYELVSHFRLTWRLFWDDNVRWWHRAIWSIPLVYLVIPFRYDVLVDLAPVVGLLDDWLLALLCSYVFVAICPRRIVRRHRLAIALSDPDPDARERARADQAMLAMLTPVQRLEMYRHPQESLALALGMAILAGLSALGGIVLGVLVVLAIGISYALARLVQTQVLSSAVQVDGEAFPRVVACLARCYEHLPYVPIHACVVESPRLNAYTFGIDHPYTLVLTSGLLKACSDDELTAVVGHEMGHFLFEHTFLSSLMGGMLNRGFLAGLIWSVVFLRWRRLAEMTADRISLLACGQLEVSIRTLIQLATGGDDEQGANVEEILDQVYADKRADLFERLEGFGRTHPQLVARVRALVDFDAELFALDVEKWLAADG